MGNKEILDYVRNTPGNTNPSVLKGMLDSLGGIDMTILFDGDLTGFSYSASTQYGPATAQLPGSNRPIIPTSTVGNGILKITYDGVSKFTILDGSQYAITFSEFDSSRPVGYVNIGSYYDPKDSITINMQGRSGQDAEFEAYCQEPHHLKVEWFTV